MLESEVRLVTKFVLGLDGTVDPGSLRKCKMLDAVINESLRLHPPIPSTILRQSPAEGIWIGDQFIPGDTTMHISIYSLHRSMFHPRHSMYPPAVKF